MTTTDDAVFAAMEPHEPGQFATHATPLVRNCWYVAARADEVGRVPLARRLLGTDVVLYRTEAGVPGDEAVDTFLIEASAKAYHEDVEALEWIMDVVRNDADPHIELSFATDKPGLMARRIIYRLARKETR